MKSPAIIFLLVAEPILIAAIGALPRDSIARHPPKIVLHTSLADTETAAASPTEPQNVIAAVTGEGRDLPSPFTTRRLFGVGITHILISPTGLGHYCSLNPSMVDAVNRLVPDMLRTTDACRHIRVQSTHSTCIQRPPNVEHALCPVNPEQTHSQSKRIWQFQAGNRSMANVFDNYYCENLL